MNSSTTFSLEEYQVQRKYRQQKRKQYLRKFELLKYKMGISEEQPRQVYAKKPKIEQIAKPSTSRVTEQKHTSNLGEEQLLTRQNEQLRTELMQFEQKERKNLQTFKQKISQVKGKYIARITQINKLATAQQNSSLQKIKKLSQQIELAEQKNKQIEQFNQKIIEQVQESKTIMNKYSTEIKNQYSAKLQQFEKIFTSSSEKIEAMEQQYQDDSQFIATTLQNQDLIATIKDNAEKASVDVEKILSDYKQLYEGKSEILKQLTSNNEMKQRQIQKMGQLQGKLKTVFDRLNEEKKMYINENTKMAEQLMQVKKLLMVSMPQNDK